MEFSKLQEICLTLIITKIDNAETHYINLLDPNLKNQNQQVSDLLTHITRVAIGNVEAVHELEKFFNLISSDSFEKLLNLGNETLYPQQENFLKILVDSLREIKKPELRALTNLEEALISLLIHMASNNLDFLTSDVHQCLLKATLGDEGAQQKILDGAIDGVNLTLLDKTSLPYLIGLNQVIAGFNELFDTPVKCMMEIKKDEESEKSKLEEILEKYQKAYDCAFEVLKIGHPNAGNLIDIIISSLYSFACLKVEKAKQEEDPNKGFAFLQEAHLLGEKLKEFNHEQAQNFLIFVQQLSLAFKEEQANKAYVIAEEKFEEARRYSNYYGDTFKLANQFAAQAKQLGSKDAPSLLNKMFNSQMEKSHRTIAQRIGVWLSDDYKDNTQKEQILKSLNLINKETEFTTTTIRIDQDLKDLIQSSFFVMKARDHIVSNDLEAAFELLAKIKDTNINKHIIETLLQRFGYNNDSDKPKKKEKPKIKTEDDENKLPVSPSKPKKVKESLIQDKPRPEKPRSVKPKPNYQEEIESNPKPQNYSTAKKGSSLSRILTSFKRLTQNHETTKSIEDEIFETEQILPKVQPTVAPIEIVETQPLLTVASQYSINSSSNNIPQKKVKNYLSIALMIIGATLLAGGIVGLCVASGGTATFFFIGMIVAGLFTGGTGVKIAAPRIAKWCRNSSNEDNPEITYTINSTAHKKDPKPGNVHYDHPYNSQTRKKEPPKTKLNTEPPTSNRRL